MPRGSKDKRGLKSDKELLDLWNAEEASREEMERRLDEATRTPEGFHENKPVDDPTESRLDKDIAQALADAQPNIEGRVNEVDFAFEQGGFGGAQDSDSAKRAPRKPLRPSPEDEEDEDEEEGEEPEGPGKLDLPKPTDKIPQRHRTIPGLVTFRAAKGPYPSTQYRMFTVMGWEVEVTFSPSSASSPSPGQSSSSSPSESSTSYSDPSYSDQSYSTKAAIVPFRDEFIQWNCSEEPVPLFLDTVDVPLEGGEGFVWLDDFVVQGVVPRTLRVNSVIADSPAFLSAAVCKSSREDRYFLHVVARKRLFSRPPKEATVRIEGVRANVSFARWNRASEDHASQNAVFYGQAFIEDSDSTEE